MIIKKDFLRKNEGSLTILQIAGFMLLLLGVISLIISSFFKPDIYPSIPSIISISFFVTMLGFSFAFPSLLEGNEGLSTMRIVVFMITNVICMLLLKIGWANGIASLEQIGLNQYWMGVIAFVFGAKATQSFFESRMAIPKETPKVGMAAIEYTNAEIAKLALVQNEQYLKVKFPNILSVSDAVHDLDQSESHVIALYLKDNNTVGIPDRLEVKMPDGKTNTISTEIVKGVGSGKINISQKDEIRNGGSNGSICCIVETDDGSQMVVTAGHVFSKGESINYGGKLSGINQTDAKIKNITIGNWFFQIINFKSDVALASIINYTPDTDCKSFAGKSHYSVSDCDIKKTKVKLVSTVSGVREGFILDYNIAWDIEYNNEILQKNKIILIGSTSERNDSHTLSQRGDSGGCVYELNSEDLVGIILGGNERFTWVLSLEEVFNKNNFKLI
jgi:hypothetical protein